MKVKEKSILNSISANALHAFFLVDHALVRTSMSAPRTMEREIASTHAKTLPGHSAVHVPQASSWVTMA